MFLIREVPKGAKILTGGTEFWGGIIRIDKLLYKFV